MADVTMDDAAASPTRPDAAAAAAAAQAAAAAAAAQVEEQRRTKEETRNDAERCRAHILPADFGPEGMSLFSLSPLLSISL